MAHSEDLQFVGIHESFEVDGMSDGGNAGVRYGNLDGGGTQNIRVDVDHI